VGRKTLTRYTGVVDEYLIPSLGHVALRKLTPLHIEDALAAWRKAQPKNRNSGELSLRTVHHIFTTLRTALTQAVRWNLNSQPVRCGNTAVQGTRGDPGAK
jgi:hypothetical protein